MRYFFDPFPPLKSGLPSPDIRGREGDGVHE